MISFLVSHLIENEIDGYLFNTSDNHNNENIGSCDFRLQKLTGFTGSNALAFLSKDRNILWTDGRYKIQVKSELKNNFVFIEKINEFYEIINENYKKVGLDKRNFSYSFFNNLKSKTENVEYKNVDDIIDKTIKPDERIFNKIYDLESYKMNNYINNKFNKDDFEWLDFDSIFLEDNITGSKRIDKIQKIRENLKKDEIYVLTVLDEIAWLFNMRGIDIHTTTVFYSFAIISYESSILYTGDIETANKILEKEDGNNYLNNYKTYVKDYYEFEKDLLKIENKKIKISKEVNSFIYDTLKIKNKISFTNEISKKKSIKNRMEILGSVLSHIYDAISLCKLFDYLQEKLDKFENVSENDASKKLADLKKEHNGFLFPSFDSISGYGKNGAQIHYKGGETHIQKNSLYLLDSGSQYLFGTTDVTRTVCFGEPSDEHKEMFTLVLKGQLDAMNSLLPKKTNGSALDYFARRYLWNNEYDFPHSTGHGVGHSLNVHESPPSISTKGTEIESEMIFSIEPGYYKENDFGIRIEDLVVTKNYKEDFIKMHNLTLAPLQKKMINENLLNEDHKKYLKSFNEKVRNILGRFLDENELGYKFMMENTY
ncbi:Xaa-Pro aminopeptidase 2 [Gurleya vavrai]